MFDCLTCKVRASNRSAARLAADGGQHSSLAPLMLSSCPPAIKSDCVKLGKSTRSAMCKLYDSESVLRRGNGAAVVNAKNRQLRDYRHLNLVLIQDRRFEEAVLSRGDRTEIC
jgi:hypothetical protein